MKSLIANFADSERMFKICLLLTKSDFLTAGIILLSYSLGTNTLFLSSLRGSLKSRILLSLTKNLKKPCSSGLKSDPLSLERSHILRIYLWKSSGVRSRPALLMITFTPCLMSSNVLNDFNKFLVSLGNLSARASLIWDSSIMSTILTLG